MDIKAEKLYLIEQLTKIQDVEIIRKIKEILGGQSAPLAGSEPGGKPITQADMLARAAAANRAIKEGKVTSMEDLEKEAENW